MIPRITLRLSSIAMATVGTISLCINLMVPIVVVGFIYITGTDLEAAKILWMDITEPLTSWHWVLVGLSADWALIFWLFTSLAEFHVGFKPNNIWVDVLFGTFAVVFTAIPLCCLSMGFKVGAAVLAIPVLFLVSSLILAFSKGR